jgi:hypothetical protein
MSFPYSISHHCCTYELSIHRGFELMVVLLNNEILQELQTSSSNLEALRLVLCE